MVNYFNSESGAKATVDEIKSLGGEAIAVKADASNVEDIKNLKAKTVETFGEDLALSLAADIFA